jgi:hypothetical protein
MAAAAETTFKSTSADVEIPVLPVTEFVWGRCASSTEESKLCFINNPDGRTMTFGEVKAAVNRAANGLLKLGCVTTPVVTHPLFADPPCSSLSFPCFSA